MPPPGARLRVATYRWAPPVSAPTAVTIRITIATVVGELDADIVALQEFTYAASVAIETREPVELVALDGYECALGPTPNRGTVLGNALLTRHPIVEVHRLDLSLDGREPPGALAATVDVGDTSARARHPSSDCALREHQFQVQQLLAYFDSVRHSLVVVLGDINDWVPLRVHGTHPESPAGGRAQAALVSLVAPHVVARPDLEFMPADLQNVVHRSALARRASDHLPVVADIALDETQFAQARRRSTICARFALNAATHSSEHRAGFLADASSGEQKRRCTRPASKRRRSPVGRPARRCARNRHPPR